MSYTRSADGTRIAFDRNGSGPAVVLVDGAMCFRAAGPLPALAAQLSDDYTVYTYDRRGRGESGDSAPYAVDREVEDLLAVVREASGSAYVYGVSSGAALAVRAAARPDSGILRLALYEAPYVAETDEPGRVQGYGDQLRALLEQDRRGDAVALFMTQVGVPAPAIEAMRGGPGWPTLVGIARTLAYDDAILGDGRVPRALLAQVGQPALVLSGGASPHGLQQAAKATADALPGAEHRTLAGQTHDVAPDALAPVLKEFFA